MSRLSPFAPPFTLDHLLTSADRPSSPSPSPPPPPTAAHDQTYLPPYLRPDSPSYGAAAADRTPSSPAAAMTRFTTTTSSSIFAPLNTPSCSMSGSSAIEAASYNPSYPQAFGCTPCAVGDGLGPRVIGRNRRSSWMNPSSIFKASTFQKGTPAEGFMACEDAWGPWHGKIIDSSVRKSYSYKHPEICEKGVRAPCNISGTSVLGTSAVHEGLPYYHPQPFISMMEECNAYNSNPSYDIDRYGNHSCSTNPYYPNSYSSPQAYGSSARRSSSSMDCSTSANTYSSKFFDGFTNNILPKRKELNINHNAESKESCMERNMLSNNKKTDTRTYVDPSFKTNSFSGIDSTTRNPTNCLIDVISGLSTTNLNLPSEFPFQCGYAKPDDFLKTSSKTLDQPDLSVDSPCWKGTLVSREYPFDVGVSSTQSSPEKDESLNGIEKGADSCFYFSRWFSPVVGLPTREKGFQDANEKGTEENEKEGQCSDVLGGQSTKLLNCQKRDPEPKECAVKELDHEGGIVSADQHILAGETDLEFGPCVSYQVVNSSISAVSVPGDIAKWLGSFDPTGKCSPTRKDVQLLVKTMHGLSEVLLSTSYGNTDELEERNDELAQLAIDNIKAFILKNNKGTTSGNSIVSGLEAAQSQVEVSKADVVMNRCNDNSNQDVNVKKHQTNVAEVFERSNGRAQVSEKALMANFNEQEENLHTLLYKKLWIQAEVASCELKYELQLARLNLEMQNHNKQAKANSHDSSEPASKSVQTEPALDGCEPQERPCYNSATLGDEVDESSEDAKKTDEVDASVIERFRVLKALYEESSSTSAADDQQTCTVRSSPPVNEDYFNLIVQPPELYDLRLMESNSQPYTEADPREKIWSYESTTGESQACSDDGQPNELDVPSEKEENVLSGGDDSRSSEWEHVSEEEEEIIWYHNIGVHTVQQPMRLKP